MPREDGVIDWEAYGVLLKAARLANGYTPVSYTHLDEAHAQQDEHETRGDEHARAHASCGDADERPLHEHGALLVHEQVQERGHHHDEQQRRERPRRIAERDARGQVCLLYTYRCV